MPADYSRIHRLLRVLTLIQGSEGWTAERLAGECGVSERTIYRDLKMLEGAGIPYFFDEDKGGYQVRRDFFMPPVALTLDESLALIALAEHVGGSEQIPLMKAAARAIAKVRSALPASVRDEVAGVDEHISIELARSGPHEGIQDVYDSVRDAIASRRVLRCRYESIERSLRGDADGEVFELRPYALFFSQRSWYVLGHHGGRDEVRCLKLNRFEAIASTAESYEIPEDFSVQGYVGNAWRMIRGSESHEVVLRFDREFAETVADTHWHRTQEVEWNEDGSIEFRCTVDGLDEIVWWVLGMGPACVVMEPRELAERVQELARAITERYAAEGRAQARGAAG